MDDVYFILKKRAHAIIALKYGCLSHGTKPLGIENEDAC